MNQPVLLITPRPAAPCTHPALRYLSPDRWQCAICEEEVTEINLIDQKRDRQQKSRIVKLVKENDDGR